MSVDSLDEGHTTPDSTGTSDGNINSSADGAYAPTNGWKRKLESMQEMVAHVTQFVQIGSPHMKDKTLQVLHTIVTDVGTVSNVSKIWAHKTSTGIKDTFLETFLEWMHLSYKNKSNRYKKQVALDHFRSTLLAHTSMFSPMWQIWGIFILSVACLS